MNCFDIECIEENTTIFALNCSEIIFLVFCFLISIDNLSMKGNKNISLDEIDQLIVAILQDNADLNVKEIAEKVGLSTTPTYERIKRLEKNKVIKKYVALVDERLLGFELTVLCNVQIKEHSSQVIEDFEKQIVTLPEVKACYHVAGNIDYLLKIVIEDMDTYSYFIKNKLSKIPCIAQVQSSFVMRTLKEL